MNLSRWKKRNSDGFLWSIQEQEDEIGRRILTWSKEIKGPRYSLSVRYKGVFPLADFPSLSFPPPSTIDTVISVLQFFLLSIFSSSSPHRLLLSSLTVDLPPLRRSPSRRFSNSSPSISLTPPLSSTLSISTGSVSKLPRASGLAIHQCKDVFLIPYDVQMDLGKQKTLVR
ncbi:unnamed protein product [Citrullus colocynthis]|uniref:Uncharacterized protein n=1 Tax=Citrullus colocynthis TaxID=252529 RepID=A0ABP0Z490_9ROSI